jgi:hypothetical protein
MSGTDEGVAPETERTQAKGSLESARLGLFAVLTPREWMVLFKIIAIAILLFVLVYTKVAVEFPAEQFIYGRF